MLTNLRNWKIAAALVGALTATLSVACTGASGFGIEHYALSTSEYGGSSDTQAGSHPYELTAEVSFTETGSLNNLQLEFPPGLTLDGYGVLCTFSQFEQSACPNDSAVGVVTVEASGKSYLAAVYDIEPSLGDTTTVGFVADGIAFFADAHLRPSDYGTTLEMKHVSQIVSFERIGLTLWGYPGDPRHDTLRGGCATGAATECPSGASQSEFVTLPTACSGGTDTTTTALADSWQNQAQWISAQAPFSQMKGCNRLPFAPSLGVSTDVVQAGEPSGYVVRLNIPQYAAPQGLASAQTQSMSVTLPLGTSLSLAATNGLSGCEDAQFAALSNQASMCPESSKIGQAEIVTRLIANPLKGAVYLATPNANPLGALVGLYVIAEDPTSGMRLKFAGQMTLDPITGQPTLAFNSLSQLPIGEINMRLFGGARALLLNPPMCGAAESTASLTPWSGGTPVTPSSSFDMSWEPGEQECPNPLLFKPTLRVEPASAPAGSYGSLILAASVEGRQQDLSRFSARLPTGLTWTFSNVQPCGEPQASQGSCPRSSQIGTAIVTVGFNRLAWFTGAVYLTEGYAGAPYGLSIVFDAVAGPFDLGEMVVRAAVGQDTSTGALIIIGDPLPRMLDGIALRTSSLEIGIDHGGFVLNPTDCGQGLLVAALLEGDEGTTVQQSSPYVVEGCQSQPNVPPSSPGALPHDPRVGGPPSRPGKHAVSRIREHLVGAQVLLAFRTSVGGLVRIVGQGVRSFSRRFGVGAHEVRLTLSKYGALEIRRHHHLKLELTLKTAGGRIGTLVLVRP